jgi:hypothetical protein
VRECHLVVFTTFHSRGTFGISIDHVNIPFLDALNDNSPVISRIHAFMRKAHFILATPMTSFAQRSISGLNISTLKSARYTVTPRRGRRKLEIAVVHVR